MSEDAAAEVPRLQNSSYLPNLATIKDFLRFQIATSQGRIDEKGRMTAESVNDHLRILIAVLFLFLEILVQHCYMVDQNIC